MNPIKNHSLTKFIQQTIPFKEIDVNEIVNSFHSIKIKKGEFLLKKNQISNDYFYLQKGLMRTYLYNLEGDQITTDFFTENNIVFEVTSFFKRVPSEYPSLQPHVRAADARELRQADLQAKYSGVLRLLSDLMASSHQIASVWYLPLQSISGLLMFGGLFGMWRPAEVVRDIGIGLAVVREQFVDFIDGVLGDGFEYISEPGVGVDQPLQYRESSDG